jgi:hypothetical protein
MNPFTDEQYKSEYRRIQSDDRYPPQLKAWGIEQIKQIYRERNDGKEPPQVQEET